MKVHLTLLLLGAVVQPVGLFTIGTVMGRGYIVDGIKDEPLYPEQTLDQYACEPDHGRSDSADAESEVWTLDGNR